MTSGVLLYLRFFHQLFAFVFVGSLLSAHWNVLAARRTRDATRRAALLEANARSTAMFGLPSLVLLELLGNAMAPGLGHRTADGSSWLLVVNGIAVVLVLLSAALDLPAARRLAAAARAAADGAATPGYDTALARWRMSNALMLAGFLALLALMVFRWRA
jgi:uncharacterized membrane protein